MADTSSAELQNSPPLLLQYGFFPEIHLPTPGIPYYLPAPAETRWKFRHVAFKAQIAQLVEQLAFNQLVLGSSPSLRTLFSKFSNCRPFQRIFHLSLLPVRENGYLG